MSTYDERPRIVYAASRLACGLASRLARGLACACLAAALLLSAGCGASPESVAEDAAVRFLERSFEDLDAYVAQGQRAEFRDWLAEFQGRLADPQEPDMVALAGMNVEVRRAAAGLLEEDLEHALVRLDLDLELTPGAQGRDVPPFLAGSNQAVTLRLLRAKGTLDVALVKEQGRWRVDVASTTDLWEAGFADW